MTERIEQFLEDHAGGHGVEDYPAAVDALVATRLLSPDRAQSWKAEHAGLRASSTHQGPYDGQVEATATELLETLFAPVRPQASDGWDPALYQRYQEALSTLVGIRALSHERARPWFERQHQTLRPAGGWPEPEPDPEMLFAAGELTAVLITPTQRLEGMRVTCLELYDDCVVARFHQRLPSEPADPVERREFIRKPFELQDDAGTAYRPAPIPSPRGCKRREIKGWPEVIVGWQAFVPGAPLDARAFTVGWREQRFRLSLEAPPPHRCT
jgi:hypothetical protein